MAPPHTLTDGEPDAGLGAGVQAAVAGQARVQACVGPSGAGDGVGRPGVDLSVVTEPHIVTPGVGCVQAAQGHLFPFTGPETLLTEAQWLHGDHRVVWTIWRERKTCVISPGFIPSLTHIILAELTVQQACIMYPLCHPPGKAPKELRVRGP